MGSFRILPGCTACGNCVAVCPTGSTFWGLGQYVIDRDTCTDCAICVKVCPVEVIQPCREDRENGAKAASPASLEHAEASRTGNADEKE